MVLLAPGEAFCENYALKKIILRSTDAISTLNDDMEPNSHEIIQEENENKENNNVEEFREFILQQKPKNTKIKTQSDMKTWKRFCLAEDESREIIDLPEEELNLLLCKFFKNIKKVDGTEYEPGTLTPFQRSIQRSLNESGSIINIIEGEKFKLSREVLSSKRRKLVVEHGKGNRQKAARELTEADEDKLFACGEFGISDPTVLQRTVWWVLALHFGFRARDESRRLKWGDVALEKDPETENDILVWKYERGSKTRQGQDKSHSVRAFHPTAQATGNERCPVKLYKEFVKRRPVEMNGPDSPFYLAVKHQRKPEDEVWYMKSPLGHNEIGKFLSTAAKNAGLQGRVTNHSVRKTCISRLLDADVSENYVAQLSGHRSLKSLDAYKSASFEHQRRMSRALSRSNSNQNTAPSCKETTTRPTASVTSVESRSFNPIQMGSGFFAGATIGSFNNCTFNIQLVSGQVSTTNASEAMNTSAKHPRIDSGGQMD